MIADRKVYQPPPLPLPLLNQKYIDPVFGTEILRATDASDFPDPGCGTFYSQWPTFNCDNTRLLIRAGESGDVIIKEFDPVGFSVGATVRRTPTLPGGVSLTWQGATWSRVDPDLIFVHVNYYDPNYPLTGLKLYSYRPSSDTFILLKDFTSISPNQPDYLFELHVANDDLFSLQHKRVGGGDALFFIVWKKSTDSVLLHLATDDPLLFPVAGTNACLLDKSGRYVYFSPNGSPVAGQPRIKILDLVTDKWQQLNWVAEDDPVSHSDLGTGTLVGHGQFSGRATIRPLSDIHAITPLFDYKDANGVTDWSNDQHTSMYADDEGWAMMSLYDEGEVGETGVFENEVMQFSTSDPNQFRRLFHHRSKVDNLTPVTSYWGIPKATISRDGKFIAYTSNWGLNERTDLFIARIGTALTPAPIPAPTPAPTPTPDPVPQPQSPCMISAPPAITIPRNGSGDINITLSNLTEPTTITVIGSDGQVTVSPLSKVASPTSAVLAFKVRVKKQSRVITFQSPCGSVQVRVNVS